jgi:AraC-like DNA-binding protein
MRASDSYGEAFGRRLNAQASGFVTRSLPKAQIAVTELRYDHPQFVLSTPPAEEDAFVVGLHLELFERYLYWENGRAAPPSTLRPGEAIIYHLARKPTFHLNSAFHSVHFYLPTSALRSIAEEAQAPPVDELRYKPGVSHADAFLHASVEALLPLFAAPQCANRVFVDHVMLAVGHHVAMTYGGMVPRSKPLAGGLTPTQERRAKELLMANLTGDIPLSALATECGLSTSQFARAFRRSMGTPPHRWLLQQRIEHAKGLLRGGHVSLEEIALATGFSSQSHFTRCFSAQTGVSPGRWRRSTPG